MRATLRIGTLILVLLFITAPARAHVLDRYGFGPRAVGMGGAYCAVADDFSALWYNVGGLTQIEGNSIHAGFMMSRPLLSLDLDPAKGVTKKQARALDELEKNQADVDEVNGYLFAITVKPHRILAFGIGAYLPEGLVVRLDPLDAHIPTFVLHENRSQRVVSLVGGSIRVLPTLSVGGGIRLFLKTKGTINIPLALNQENLEIQAGEQAQEPLDPATRVKLDFPLTTYPFFGVHFQPMENLRLGVSYQHGYTLELNIKAKVDLSVRNYTLALEDLQRISPNLFPIKAVVELNIPELGDTPLRVPVELDGLEGDLVINAQAPIEAFFDITDLWKPHSITAGAAYEPIDALTLSFDAVFYNWSAYPSPDLKLTIEDIHINLQTLPASIRARVKSLGVPILGTIGPLPPVTIDLPGLEAQLRIPMDMAAPTPVKTHDIVVPRFGLEYRFPTVRSFWWTGDLDVALRGGYVYSPTPFETDRGASNLIDSDTHSITSGLGLQFNQLFKLDFYGQYQYFVPITVSKDPIDPNMPFERYTASGHILGGGFSAGVTW